MENIFKLSRFYPDADAQTTLCPVADQKRCRGHKCSKWIRITMYCESGACPHSADCDRETWCLLTDREPSGPGFSELGFCGI